MRHFQLFKTSHLGRFHSIRLIFGRAIISRREPKACHAFLSGVASRTPMVKRRRITRFLPRVVRRELGRGARGGAEDGRGGADEEAPDAPRAEDGPEGGEGVGVAPRVGLEPRLDLRGAKRDVGQLFKTSSLDRFPVIFGLCESPGASSKRALLSGVASRTSMLKGR